MELVLDQTRAHDGVELVVVSVRIWLVRREHQR